MAPINQLFMPPMALNKVASPQATPGNKVASVTLAGLISVSAAHVGVDLGDVFDLSLPEVTKNFGPNNPERNRLMKVELPMNLLRQMALQLCEVTGLAVGGPDQERHALADVLKACSEYVRVVSR